MLRPAKEGILKTDLQIEQWLIDRLIPYARNSRTHSEEQIAQIAASIAEFGFVNPILFSLRSPGMPRTLRADSARPRDSAETPRPSAG